MKIKVSHRPSNVNRVSAALREKPNGEKIGRIRLQGELEPVTSASIDSQHALEIKALAGDVIVLSLGDGARAVTRAHELAQPMLAPLRDQDKYAFFVPPGGVDLYVMIGGEQVHMRFKAAPVPGVTNVPMIGAGAYAMYSGWGNTDTEWATRRWTREGTKATGARGILSSSNWLEGLYPPFRRVGKSLDLSGFDPRFRQQFIHDMTYALVKKQPHCADIFCAIGIKGDRWHSSPYNYLFNIHGELNMSDPFAGSPERTLQEFQHAVMGDKGERSLAIRDVLMEMVQQFQRMLPAGHLICTGNEHWQDNSRAAEREVVSWLSDKHRIIINLPWLWDDDYPEVPNSIVKDRVLWNRCHGFRLHHCDEARVPSKWKYIKKLVDEYAHLMVYFDDDGAGGGSVRGENNRPTIESVMRAIDLAQDVSGERFGGYFIKTVSEQDTSEVLKAL